MFGAQTGRFGLPFAFRIAAAGQNCALPFCPPSRFAQAHVGQAAATEIGAPALRHSEYPARAALFVTVGAAVNGADLADLEIQAATVAVALDPVDAPPRSPSPAFSMILLAASQP